MKLKAVSCIIMAMALISSSLALADDGYVLAKSKMRKLQVVADGGDGWCAAALHLRMLIEADSPNLGNLAAQKDTMNLLREPIESGCKAAQTAELKVYENGQEKGTFKAAEIGGWIFTSVSIQAVEGPDDPVFLPPKIAR